MSSIDLLRIETVASRRGRGRSQLYLDIREGLMTPSLRLSRKLSAWPSHEVDALNRAEIAGATPEEIRALVCQLVEQRRHAFDTYRESGSELAA